MPATSDSDSDDILVVDSTPASSCVSCRAGHNVHFIHARRGTERSTPHDVTVEVDGQPGPSGCTAPTPGRRPGATTIPGGSATRSDAAKGAPCGSPSTTCCAFPPRGGAGLYLFNLARPDDWVPCLPPARARRSGRPGPAAAPGLFRPPRAGEDAHEWASAVAEALARDLNRGGGARPQPPRSGEVTAHEPRRCNAPDGPPDRAAPGGGDPVGSQDVDLPPDVEMETLESFVGQRFGEPLDVALVEHPTLGVVRVGWVLEVPVGMEVPGRHEDFELVLIPMIAESDDPRSLVSVFLRLAESQAEFERLAAEGTVDRLVVRDMVPREYRPQPGAVSRTGDPDIGGVLAGIAHDLGGWVRAYPRPGRAVRRVVLRDIRDEDGTRYLDAAIESDGTLRVTGHDEGPGVSQVFGPAITSYEWVYVVAPDRVAALVDELGGTVGDDALTLLQARHDQGSEGLDAVLRSPRINAQFDSWHGSAGPVEPADQAGRGPGEAGSARAEEQTREAAVQAEHGAAATGRAVWSATTEGEEDEPVADELPPELLNVAAARRARARRRFAGARRTGLRLGPRPGPPTHS